MPSGAAGVPRPFPLWGRSRPGGGMGGLIADARGHHIPSRTACPPRRGCPGRMRGAAAMCPARLPSPGGFRRQGPPRPPDGLACRARHGYRMPTPRGPVAPRPLLTIVDPSPCPQAIRRGPLSRIRGRRRRSAPWRIRGQTRSMPGVHQGSDQGPETISHMRQRSVAPGRPGNTNRDRHFQEGSSPHAQGWTESAGRLPGVRGVFPARAGVDRRSTGCTTCRGRLPRTRGGGPEVLSQPVPATASSPHARGWTVGRALLAADLEVFPARAGVNRPSSISPWPSAGIPRMRGGESSFARLSCP